MDFAWLYGKWKVFSLPFAKPHTYYRITDRVSGLSQNQVTHQFNLFHLVHDRVTQKALDHIQHTLYSRHLVQSLNVFLMPGHTKFLISTAERKTNVLWKSFQQHSSRENLPQPCVQTPCHMEQERKLLSWPTSSYLRSCQPLRLCLWSLIQRGTTEETISWGVIFISFFLFRV